MERIVELLFQAYQLKHTQRTGYQFLGIGRESVAEHSFATAFIAYVLSQLEPAADRQRLLAMCLVHDLPEARTGDLNYVQKMYVQADSEKAVADTIAELPFGDELAGLIAEFETGRTLESQLAHDADQLSFIIELKALADKGYAPPESWLPNVVARLKTLPGRQLGSTLLAMPADHWWRKFFVDRSDGTQ
ncbi:MAG: HD domain-containing protein [Desulfosarcinaceae bacterium]|nr:HD domain-containing protein [Desulfosarcinaceae bacterium]